MAESVRTRASAQSPDTIFDQWADEGAAARAAQSPAPSESIPRVNSSGQLFELTIGLDGLEELMFQVQSVAEAGKAYLGDEKGTPHSLFSVIATLASNASCLNLARDALEKLGEAAERGGRA